MADSASMVINGSYLPDEIQKKFIGETYKYTPANDTEGWYYKLTNVTTTASIDLIDDGHSYVTFGNGTGTAQGRDTGTDMPQTHADDVVKFLFIKHLGIRETGATNTSDSIYLCTDGGTAANDLSTAIEILPTETWFVKLNCTIANLHARSGAKANGGAGGNSIQCLVAAIIDDVA